MPESPGRSIRGKPVKRLGGGSGFSATAMALERFGLSTVCREASCPNRGECWEERTATFLLLGNRCTRGCGFCSVRTGGSPDRPEPEEPAKVADAAATMGLLYVVLTSVTRDDLPDGGASHFAATVRAVKERSPGCEVETLTPDFRGASLSEALSGGQEVFAHNIETVERLTPYVRHPAFSYRNSLATLREAKTLRAEVATKSSILIGLGETREEILTTMRDLRDCGVSILAIGQYFRPESGKLAAEPMLDPGLFENYAACARELGFPYVVSGPLVRTSYKAREAWRAIRGGCGC